MISIFLHSIVFFLSVQNIFYIPFSVYYKFNFQYHFFKFSSQSEDICSAILKHICIFNLDIFPLYFTIFSLFLNKKKHFERALHIFSKALISWSSSLESLLIFACSCFILIICLCYDSLSSNCTAASTKNKPAASQAKKSCTSF